MFIISAAIVDGFTFTVYVGVYISNRRNLAFGQADNLHLGEIKPAKESVF